MKKKYLAILCSPFLAAVLAGCGNNEQSPTHTHQLTHYAARSATHTEAGNIEYWECSSCNKLFSDANGTNEVTTVIIEATPEHTYANWQVTTPATCTTAGEETGTCSCGKTDTRSISALGHDVEKVTGQAATHLEDGWKDYYKCKREGCNALFEDEAKTKTIANLAEWKAGDGKIDAKVNDHTFTGWTVVNPTLSSKGSISRNCETEGCDKTETYELPILNNTDYTVTENDGIRKYVITIDSESFEFYVYVPEINNGVLTWKGSASEYKVYEGDTLLGTVSEKTLNLPEILKFTVGSHDIQIKASDNSEEFVLVSFEIVGLTQDNFVDTLSESSSDKYYVLTENVSLTTEYDGTKQINAKGKYEDPILYAPIAEFSSVLDGRGYKLTISYNGGAKVDGGWEAFGGLFGYTENAVIKNLNYDFTAQLNGHVINLIPGGALVGVMGSNTVIQDCYINSVYNVWNAADSKGLGAIAGKLFGGSTGCILKNNIASSKLMHNDTQQESPDKLIASVNENVAMNGNAYIINKNLPETISTGGIYDEAFMAWGVDGNDNWLFASLVDFLTGSGHKCTYHGATNWSRAWELSQTPAQVLCETEAWAGTTFDFDEVLTLCGKAIFELQEVTPTINRGVLTWTGNASSYEIYDGETLLGTVTGTSCDLAELVEYAPGTYEITVKGVNDLTNKYKAVSFEIIGLTSSNFVSELSSSTSDDYFVLTENVSLSYGKTDNGDYGTGVDVMPIQSVPTWKDGTTPMSSNVYAPIKTLSGVLDGRGYKVSISYAGDNEEMAGLFASIENGVVRNLNFYTEWHVWGNLLESGALTKVLGANSVVENSYIKSKLFASDGDIKNNVGALAERVLNLGGNAPQVRNCIFDTELVHFSELNHIDQKNLLVKNVAEPFAALNNAFIINTTLDSAQLESGGNYFDCFYSDNLAGFNTLYGSLNDFIAGQNGVDCSWIPWNRTFTDNNEKVYESEAWAGTTFAVSDGTLTLCGKNI